MTEAEDNCEDCYGDECVEGSRYICCECPDCSYPHEYDGACGCQCHQEPEPSDGISESQADSRQR